MKKEWHVPEDMDQECIELCKALNKFHGIKTNGSCCGHGKYAYSIQFLFSSKKALAKLLYWLNPWSDKWPVLLFCPYGTYTLAVLRGPIGDFAKASLLSRFLLAHVDVPIDTNVYAYDIFKKWLYVPA